MVLILLCDWSVGGAYLLVPHLGNNKPSGTTRTRQVLKWNHRLQDFKMKLLSFRQTETLFINQAFIVKSLQFVSREEKVKDHEVLNRYKLSTWCR